MGTSPLGFIGLGVMGLPMATRLAQAGQRLVVWNRTPDRGEPLRAIGATLADSPQAVFAAAETVILMLATEAAMDAVLCRGTPAFGTRVAGRTLVHMGTTSPAYAQALEAEIRAAGGQCVEAPVSGSRKPAEAGQLVAMLAGPPDVVERVRPLLAPMCSGTFGCGDVPSGLLMKLSVNLFLLTMVTGHCEAFQFAQRNGLDTRLLQAVPDAGPMASSVSRMKLPKLVDDDFSVQASIVGVHKSVSLVLDAARRAEVATPLLGECHALFSQTLELGHGALDTVAVLKALEARSRDVQGR